MAIKTAAIIQARCGSSRFPGKVLEKIDGKSLLQIQWDRLRGARCLEGVVIATTGSSADDAIVKECVKGGIPVFRGSEKDVLDRYYRAAREFGVELIVRLTSDCPFIDPAVVDQVVGAYQAASGRYDYVANTVPPPGTFPDGMDVEVFSFANLERAWKEADKPSEREHVTFYFWKHPERFKLFRVDAEQDMSRYRLTVDYPEDLERLRALSAHFAKNHQFGTLEEIVRYFEGEGRALAQTTHVFGEGWKPSLEKDAHVNQEAPRKVVALKLEETEKAWQHTLRLIPTGAQTFSKTPSQFVDGVAPKMVVRGRGSKVWDLDGNEYIDYTLSLGPAVLGHAHPEVNAAAAACAADYGVNPPLPHPLETQLAEKLKSLIPCAEMIRYGKNGSDVTTAAVRLARAYTGREEIAFCGYHGWHDWHIGATTRRKGVPVAVQKLTHRFDYNRIETLEAIFKNHPDQVAAVIMEPVGHVPPMGDFLHRVREITHRHGALLIFDEIITGFRFDLKGAGHVLGVQPDLGAFGKAMANGYPLSFLCGRGEIMRQFEEVFFSFTFGGELPSMAAALKTIEIMEREKSVEHIAALGAQFRDGFNAIAKELGIRYARCIGLDFWPEYAFETAGGFTSQEMLTLVQQEIVRRGILTRAPIFISSAHSAYDLTLTLRIYREALAVLRAAVDSGKVREWIDGQLITPVIRSETSHQFMLDPRSVPAAPR